jgi:hypothetical protein
MALNAKSDAQPTTKIRLKLRVFINLSFQLLEIDLSFTPPSAMDIPKG